MSSPASPEEAVSDSTSETNKMSPSSKDETNNGTSQSTLLPAGASPATQKLMKKPLLFRELPTPSTPKSTRRGQEPVPKSPKLNVSEVRLGPTIGHRFVDDRRHSIAKNVFDVLIYI